MNHQSQSLGIVLETVASHLNIAYSICLCYQYTVRSFFLEILMKLVF